MTRGAHHRSMMTQQLGFSVLTAPIAAIDRRSLSQAWYSALHLAHHSQACKTHDVTSERQPATAQKAAVVPAGTAIRNATVVTPALHSAHKVGRSTEAPADRRSLRSPLARKIEHLFLRPNPTTTRATFTIDGSNTRVHVSMQQTRSELRLVAVCPPRVRGIVAHALEQARYALGARGIAIDAEILE